jgi:CRP-like cAMP-binding protein
MDDTVGSNGHTRANTIALLRRTQLSKFVSENQMRVLETYAETADRKPGTTIYRQGEPARTFYVVLKGSVELRAKPPGRRVYRTVEVVGDGCTMGDEAVLGEDTYLTTARVLEPAHLLMLTAHGFERLSSTNHDLGIAILRAAGSCLLQTVRRSAILTQAPADVALEMLLKELSDDDPRRNGRRGPVRITHAQLAGLLHLSRETVSRMLGQMAEKGVVELARGTIRVNQH